MAPCKHVQWVDLDGIDSDWSIAYAFRLNALVKNLPRPKSQFPTLVFFVGKRQKTSALQAIFPHNNITRHKAHGIANLHLDVTTSNIDFPIFFADCIPEFHITLGNSEACRTHDYIRHRVDCGDHGQPDLKSMVKFVQTRLLFRFVSVVCVFADDLGGSRGAVEYVQGWVRSRQSSSEPGPLPNLVIFHTLPDDIEALVQLECSEGFDGVFASLSVLSMPPNPVESPMASQLSLKEKVVRIIDDARRRRHDDRLLFSAYHLPNLFSQAVKSFAVSPDEEIDFAGIARSTHGSCDDMVIHISTFLALGRQEALPGGAMTAFIAGAILIDCYPPGMHLFPPAFMFRRFYRQHCATAIKRAIPSDGVLSQALLESISQTFDVLFHDLEEGRPSLDVRREQLRAGARMWALLNSTTSCFFCLHRGPERVIACGHAPCDVCVRGYGTVKDRAYHYKISTCDLCLARVNANIRLKPPTAGPCVMSFDGGGIKACVSLQLLIKLDRALGPSQSIQDYPDYVIATSAGALIAIDVFSRGSDLATTAARFDELARHIFRTRFSTFSLLCSRWCGLLKSWLRDSRHDTGLLEKVLKRAFGTTRRLFDVANNAHICPKIGITATTVSNSELRLFTNYNGAEIKRKDAGYARLRPQKACEEPFLWEVAIVATAAPGYFLPKLLPPFGTLQDGAMRANNPLEPGLWELEAIWPGELPNFVVSVGTGSFREVNFPGHGFIPRIIRSLMSSRMLHGQNSWMALMNSIKEEERSNYFRFNCELGSDEPDLDDYSKMSALREMVSTDTEEPDDIRDAMWASRFHFELDTEPEYNHTYHKCRGTILCRAVATKGLLGEIKSIYPAAKFLLKTDHHENQLGFVNEEDCCNRCGLFQKSIIFDVRHLDAAVTIIIVFRKNHYRRISQFPSSIKRFQHQQGLDSVFGRADHQTQLPSDRHRWCTVRGLKRKGSVVTGRKPRRPRTQ